MSKAIKCQYDVLMRGVFSYLSIHKEFTFSRHMRPDQDNLMLLAAAGSFDLTGCNRLGRGETKLEGHPTFGSCDVLSRSLGTVVYLIGRITLEVVARSQRSSGHGKM